MNCELYWFLTQITGSNHTNTNTSTNADSNTNTITNSISISITGTSINIVENTLIWSILVMTILTILIH